MKTSKSAKIYNYKFFLAAALLLSVHVFTQFPYLAQAFYFDEVAYAVKAILLLAGKGFYSVHFHDRLPGIYGIYTLAGLLFGQVSPLAVRTITLAFTSLAVVTFFGITYKMSGLIVGLISSFLFAIFFIDPAVQGHTANTEIFAVTFFIFGVFLFLTESRFLKRVAPIVVGITLLFRPTMVFSVVLFILLTYKRGNSTGLKLLFTLLAKVAIPVIITLFLVLISGEILTFLDWQITKNSIHMKTAYFGGYFFENARFTFRQIFSNSWFFWLAAILGLISFSLTKNSKIRVAYLFFGTIILSILFSGWFFQHYFIELTPILALFAGLLISKIVSVKTRFKPLILFLLVSLVLIGFIDFYFDQRAFLENRVIQRKIAVLEDEKIKEEGYLKVVNLIKQKPELGVFVWDDSGLIYVLSERVPISFFSYKQPLLPNDLLYHTFRGYFPNYLENRERLMVELEEKSPGIIIVRKTSELDKEIKGFPEFFGYLEKRYLKKDIGKFIIYTLESLEI